MQQGWWYGISSRAGVGRYWRNSKWNFQRLIKNMGRFRYCIEETERGISRSDQEKVIWNFQRGLGFRPFKFWRWVLTTQFCDVSRGETLFCLESLGVNLIIPGGVSIRYIVNPHSPQFGFFWSSILHALPQNEHPAPSSGCFFPPGIARNNPSIRYLKIIVN